MILDALSSLWNVLYCAEELTCDLKHFWKGWATVDWESVLITFKCTFNIQEVLEQLEFLAVCWMFSYFQNNLFYTLFGPLFLSYCTPRSFNLIQMFWYFQWSDRYLDGLYFAPQMDTVWNNDIGLVILLFESVFGNHILEYLTLNHAKCRKTTFGWQAETLKES